MSKPLPDWKTEKEVYRRAFLETTYWWIDNEGRYHDLFSGGRKQFDEDKELFQDTFYEFTKKYSVRRTVSGIGQQPVNDMLAELIKDINNIQEGKQDIDDYKSSVRSLTSKFATLVNPSFYSMYDGYAAKALSYLLHGRKTSVFNDYKSYLRGFNEFKAQFADTISPDDFDYWLEGFLHEKFSIDPKVCTRPIFTGRLTDKFLWCYYDMKLKR